MGLEKAVEGDLREQMAFPRICGAMLGACAVQTQWAEVQRLKRQWIMTGMDRMRMSKPKMA
jgi:hypothetical protein